MLETLHNGIKTALQEVAWNALVFDTGCVVTIHDQDGRCLFANEPAARLLSKPRESLIGTSLHDHFSREYADERVRFIRRVLTARQPLAVVDMVGGRRVVSSIRPIQIEGEGRGLVLLTAIVVGATDLHEPPPDHFEPRFVDSGPLSQLTAREIEVLKLIGRGLTTARIAEMLRRSAKTIEAHRASLGLKLGASNRVQLARIAIELGLVKEMDGQAGGRSANAGSSPQRTSNSH
jgi:DNA-binding CsgD family transcriptional regulator